MNRPNGLEKTFELLRELPPELSVEDVGRLVAAFPLVPPTGSWISHINFNPALMTSAGAIIIAASVFLYSPTEPKPRIVQVVPAKPTPVQVAESAVEPEVMAVPVLAPSPIKEKVAAPAPLSVIVPDPVPGPIAPVLAVVTITSDPGPTASLSSTIPDPGVNSSALKSDPMSKDYALSGFTSVSVTGSMNVVIAQGPFAVSAEGNAERIENLEITVTAGTLNIGTSKNMSWSSSTCRDQVAIHVTLPEMHRIALMGSGDIEVERFSDVGAMELRLQGSGDIHFTSIKGVTAFNINLDGSGDILAEGAMVAGRTKIALAGSGDVRMEGRTEFLEVSAVGSGDVDASGFEARACDARVVGSGDVVVNCIGTFNRQSIGSGDVTNTGSAGGNGARGVGTGPY